MLHLCLSKAEKLDARKEEATINILWYSPKMWMPLSSQTSVMWRASYPLKRRLALVFLGLEHYGSYTAALLYFFEEMPYSGTLPRSARNHGLQLPLRAVFMPYAGRSTPSLDAESGHCLVRNVYGQLFRLSADTEALVRASFSILEEELEWLTAFAVFGGLMLLHSRLIHDEQSFKILHT